MTLNIIIVLAAIVLGILFLLLEIFLIPGFGIAGIAGIIFLAGGIADAYIFLGATAGHITLAGSAIVLAGAFYWLVKTKALLKVSLHSRIDGAVDTNDLRSVAVGDTGMALSRLNPIGKVLIRDVTVEGKSYDGAFIEEDSEIEVVKVESYNVWVKRKESATSAPVNERRTV